MYIITQVDGYSELTTDVCFVLGLHDFFQMYQEVFCFCIGSLKYLNQVGPYGN